MVYNSRYFWINVQQEYDNITVSVPNKKSPESLELNLKWKEFGVF